MSTIRLSCCTPAPSAAGAINTSSRRTSGLRRGIRSAGKRPARWQFQAIHKSCAMPATETAQANACPGVSRRSAKNSKLAIRHKFSRIGAAAAAANRSTLLSIAPSSETREISNR